jgi:hypothetical protein
MVDLSVNQFDQAEHGQEYSHDQCRQQEPPFGEWLR